MTEPAASRARAVRAALALLLGGLLGGLLLSVAALPHATAQGRATVRLDEPVADAVLDGSFVVRATVETDQAEQVEAVTARLSGPAVRVAALQPGAGEAPSWQDPGAPPEPDGDPPTGDDDDATPDVPEQPVTEPDETRHPVAARQAQPPGAPDPTTADPPSTKQASSWQAHLDPLADEPLPNGRYLLEIRAVTSAAGQAAEPTEWVGHDVVLDVPPPRVAVYAEPQAPDYNSVEVTWTATALPDFIAYHIERGQDGRWATIASVVDQERSSITDVVAEPGHYDYRVRVVRSDGQGGSRQSISEVASVSADPADPQNSAPEPQQATQPQPGLAPGPVTVRPAPPAIDGPPAVAAPTLVPFDDGVFEETLPFDSEPPDRTVTETETAFQDSTVRGGGGLAVLTESGDERRAAMAFATGLLLVVAAGHMWRLSRQ